MTGVLLQLKSLGVQDIAKFDFLQKPPRAALVRGLEQLFALGALDGAGRLTELGSQMAQLPLEPSYAKALMQRRAPEPGGTPTWTAP